MTEIEVLALLAEIGRAVGEGMRLVDVGRSMSPVLRAAPLPDAAAEVRAARLAAAVRIDPDRGRGVGSWIRLTVFLAPDEDARLSELAGYYGSTRAGVVRMLVRAESCSAGLSGEGGES